MRKVQFSPTLLSAAILAALSTQTYAQDTLSINDIEVRLGHPEPNHADFEKATNDISLNTNGDHRLAVLLVNGNHTFSSWDINSLNENASSNGIAVTSGQLYSENPSSVAGTVPGGYGVLLAASVEDGYPTRNEDLAKGAVINLGMGDGTPASLEKEKQKVYVGQGDIFASGENSDAIRASNGNGAVKAIEISIWGSVDGDNKGNAINLSEFARGLTGQYSTTISNPVGDLLSEDAYALIGSEHSDKLINGELGKIKGAVVLRKGNDTAELDGDISKVTKLIGSEELTGSENNETNSLTLKNQTISGSSDSEGAVGNVKVLGWEHLTLQNSKFNLTGDLKLNEHKKIGQFTIDENSKLATLAADKTMYYSITNKGIIDLTSSKDKNIENNLTIAGNYQGEAGSKLLIRTTWNNPDEQKSDTLIIKGAESGSTVVEVKDGILGDVTLANKNERKDGLKANAVVKVEGTASGQVFTGTAQTEGALEAQLYYDAAKKAYYWVLDGQHNNLPAPSIPIYTQPVSSYVQTQYANRLMALDQLGRLHERVAEQKTDKGNHNTWARVRYSDTQIQGRERLGFESQRTLIQIGNDFDRTSNQNGQVINGLMLSFSRADNKFYDKYTFENGNFIGNPSKTQQYRGKVRSDMLGVQAYRTHYFANHSYVDLVGGVIGVRNRFAENAQYGYGVQASVEVGRAYPISQNWYIEPQLQLSAQWLKFRDFNENGKRIEAHSDKVVQGRAGVRFHNNQLYFKADVIHHFAKPKAVSQIGTDRISESYAATRFDIGFGVEKALNAANTFKLYGDVKYTRSIHNGNRVFSKQPAHHEYSGEIGVRYLW